MADEDVMTPRERRRSRANAGKPKGESGTLWRRYKVHVIIVLLFGGLAAAMAVNAAQSRDCPGHWHSTFDVYVNGERVSFNDPRFDLNGAAANGGSMSLAMHLHQPNDHQWHWEPVGGAECIRFGDALEVVDVDLSSSRMVLEGPAHERLGQAGTYTEDGAHNLTAWHRVGSGDWQRIGIGRLIDRQPQPDERILVVYGNETHLPEHQAKADANSLERSSGGQGGASYVPVIGVSVMGVVALAVWHSLSRRA